jgi:hypothetical protein
MLAVGEGASQEAMEQIRKLGSNNIILTAVKPVEDEQGTARRGWMSVYGLLYEDEQRIRETMPAVLRTAPVKHVRKEGLRSTQSDSHFGLAAITMRSSGSFDPSSPAAVSRRPTRMSMPISP